ncbi:hypothetical protein CCACVL1_09221 [Corchorus capsularis]|uniref:Uncharacterized protein n=1 Tax=Corchorus capsularis TaxID=210143 RepID=A0A1R3IX59_COCAP|nr:hypothetical protein CCACVL1_09221 [Corchorus capsularis]
MADASMSGGRVRAMAVSRQRFIKFCTSIAWILLKNQ